MAFAVVETRSVCEQGGVDPNDDWTIGVGPNDDWTICIDSLTNSIVVFVLLVRKN